MPNRQVVAVTGASAGVGRAVARAFGARGAAVALLARGEDGLEAAAKEVEAAGGEALAIPTDVADAGQVEAAATEIEERLGPIDIWINNAMTSVFGRFWEIAPDEFERVTHVTYLGFANGTRAALSRMRERNRGQIIQVGSALAFRGIPGQSAYCGAKHAIEGFTESVRTELMNEGSEIEIGQVHLPAMNTPQFSWVLSRLPRQPQPVPPIYQPEIAARAVLAMADRPRRTILVAAPTMATVWANKFIPGLLDRYLARGGIESQMTSEPVDADRPANLWEPVPGDWGAHGEFDNRAKDRSIALDLWLNGRKIAVTAAGVAVAAVAAAVARD